MKVMSRPCRSNRPTKESKDSQNGQQMDGVDEERLDQDLTGSGDKEEGRHRQPNRPTSVCSLPAGPTNK